MKKFTIFISIVAALGGLLFGFDTAVIAGTLQFIKPFFHLTDATIGVVVGATSVGCIPGALLAGRLADNYGRKKMMILSALFYVASSIGCGLAPSYEWLVVFRFLGGIAIGMASMLAPIYISEVAPPAFRGRLGMLQQLAIVTGILVAFISNYLIVNSPWLVNLLHSSADTYWRYMLGAAVIPSAIFFGLLLAVPESPRWLILKQQPKLARKTFSRIYSEGDANEQVKIVADDIGANPRADIKEVFSKRYSRIVLIGLVFAAVAQLTGINIVFYYAPIIFVKTHVGLSPLFQTILTGVVNLIFTILALFLIDRLGRRKLLLFGSISMGLAMLALGILFYLNALDNYYVLILIFIYIACFACTWGAVLWVYVAEIFPNRIRGTATSIAIGGNWTANAIVSFTFPVMLAGLGGAFTFWSYAAINLLTFLFVFKYIFETKGVPLERIEELYHIKPRKSA